jgi:hypothetical protein
VKTIPSQLKPRKKYVLSFVTFTGIVKYYAGGNGEIEKGEQTTDLNKAVKFDTTKELEKANDTLDAYYYKQTITEVFKDIWI